MDTKRLLGTGASALVALVLIWDEPPIALSAHDQPQVAYSDRVERPMSDRDGGREPAEAVVRGDRTGARPEAHVARPDGAADRGGGTSTENVPAADHQLDAR